MVFTDIQASTRLWAHAPDRMGEALDVHHKLLRKHKGYEVKTIGDSFMVAFKQAPQALRFAFDVQVLLYSYDLETDVFEKVYKDATAEAFGTDDVVSLRPGPLNADDTSDVSGLNTGRSLPAPEHVHGAAFSNPSSELPTPTNNGSETATAADSRYVVASHADPPPCAGALSPEDYAALWNGLRVRVGIHHGTGNIRLDETSLGYDYYGTVVNTAARVEGVGHGGQVLATDAVYESLGDATIAGLQGVVTDLGAQPLRGLPEPVRLFQILPEAFADRRFPPLRLDIENEIDEDDGLTDASGKGDDGASRRTSDTNTAVGHRYSVGEVVGDLTKRLRLRAPSASRLSIASTFDAVSTMLAAMKPAARKETMKALSAAWRVQGVWPQSHIRRMVRSNVFTHEQLLLLATVGRAVQALQVQGHGHSNDTAADAAGILAPTPRAPGAPRRAGEQPKARADTLVAQYEASITSTAQQSDRTTARGFVPGAGYAVVLRVLKMATATSAVPGAGEVQSVHDASSEPSQL